MAKSIALKDSITLDGVDISDLCSAVNPTMEDEQVDVSGFNANGTDENLAGKRTQTVVLTVFGSYGAGEIHDTVWPIYRDRLVVPFTWRPDQTTGASATNPELTGNVIVTGYSPSRTRGSADSFQVTLAAGDADGLTYSES